ncbi:class I SAM-dependent methyltransferase [Shewanella dokdonensis]|uniref:class I SAM-dependent methyltransferase n=1 Tax=Shewanella dokdonensis TaxID=712036 RepID=UPI00200C3AE1|nr:class I SAM-dependent methyltransferase [Shewanella dokdonensis]MCL1075052.1 class I SAM-dependent methyltransferase [Shewanella dokdonensis]
MQLLLDAISQLTLPSDAARLFHGRGGLYPGCEHLNLDWYAPVLLLTSFKPLAEAELQRFTQALSQRLAVLQSPCNLVYQYRASNQTETRLLCGEVPEPHLVTENGCRFQVHLLTGQNHGLFLDMANGRAWVKAHAAQCKVLNLFAYTCGFSVAAMAGGADEVVNIDMSKGALAIGKQNHLLNDMPAGVRFLGHDIFKSWGKLKKLGPYQLVIADPPSNQKGSFVATKDYLRLLRHLPELLSPGANVLLCLNAPELDRAFLQTQVAEAAPQLTLLYQLENPAVFADRNPEKALKALVYRFAAE